MSEFAFTINCYLVVAFLMVLLYYIDRCDVLFLRVEVILMICIEKRAINDVFEAIYEAIHSGKHVIITDAALKRLWEKTRTVEKSLLRRSIISKTRPNGDREIVSLAERVYHDTILNTTNLLEWIRFNIYNKKRFVSEKDLKA